MPPATDRKMPLVTIGIPTYNRADRYLCETLESAQRQTYPELEIVVSDNGSTDDTPAYIEQRRDPRIRYYRHETALAPNGNFNFCLQQAHGDYFLLLHDDDCIDTDFVEHCMDARQAHPGIGVIRSGTRLIDASSCILREAPNAGGFTDAAELMHKWFTNQTAFYFCSSLFNTDLLRQAGGLRSKHNVLEDCTAILDLTALAGQIEIQAIKASFREHANYAQYGRKLRLWVEDFLWLLERVGQRVPEDNVGLLAEGRAFFAGLSYRRARTISFRWKRWQAYVYVWKQMGLQYPPPAIARRLRRWSR